MPAATRSGFSLLTDDDVYLFNEGTHSRLYERLGAHVVTHDGQVGTAFGVWAPNADVSVIGDFNGWEPGANPLRPRGGSGIHEGFVAGVGPGAVYKFHVRGPHGHAVEKADPFGFFHEVPPRTASVVHHFEHQWTDSEWMSGRTGANALDSPISIYELHVGSWLWVADGMGGTRPASWRELAPELAGYMRRMGFTHVELMPVTEHPFGGSWGYQSTGYFAPTSRFGTPDDFAYFVDTLHRAGVGVILDWVPSHFPNDEHGLFKFDGTHLFEHADPRKGYHPDWHSAIFNYDRHEVRSFLISSALFWLDRFHIDGLRVDAVASMLYLDYSRKDGEWIPNEFGGRENLGAIQFLRQLNAEVYRRFPDAQTIAEESTAWPMVSRPTYIGGLGFGFKWDMGWMHDSLDYFSRQPVHRRFHQNDLTFRQLYAFTENFMLPLSHDEVVHGKGSLLGKMPGDEWQRFANLRLLFAFMYAQPGKKLVFMGGEFGQYAEWNHDASLDWHLLQYPLHDGVRRAVADLNRLYRTHRALHARDCRPDGFEWIDCSDADNSVIAFRRTAGEHGGDVVCAFNFTPVVRHDYRIGVPAAGYWREVFNSDASDYSGSGVGNLGGCQSESHPCHDRAHSVSLSLPPLGAVFLQQ